MYYQLLHEVSVESSAIHIGDYVFIFNNQMSADFIRY